MREKMSKTGGADGRRRGCAPAFVPSSVWLWAWMIAACAPVLAEADLEPGRSGVLGGAAVATVRALTDAKRDRPFVNSLGMRFVPVSGSRVLFSVWETRVADFQAFVRASGHRWDPGPNPAAGPDLPVSFVSWQDATDFCRWLSGKEGLRYRLPTDKEWGVAVGRDAFPWGEGFPPPPGAANLSGQESGLKHFIRNWRDNHRGPAPVGSYGENKFGIHDLGGNLREWCDDWYDGAIYREHLSATKGDKFSEDAERSVKKGDVWRVVRGGAWTACIRDQVASGRRDGMKPDESNHFTGFRCVLEPPR